MQTIKTLQKNHNNFEKKFNISHIQKKLFTLVKFINTVYYFGFVPTGKHY